MTKYSPHFNATINLGQGLAGTAFSFWEIMHVLSSAQLQTALPYWGLIQGALRTGQFLDTTYTELSNAHMRKNSRPLITIGIGNEAETISQPSFDGWRYAEEACAALTNINLIYQSIHTLKSGVATLLPWSFALSAAVGFGIAVRRTHDLVTRHQEMLKEIPGTPEDIKQLKRQVYESYAAALSKLLTALGWTAIALGNPIGWALIAIASMERIYSAVSAYQQLHKYSMFSSTDSSPVGTPKGENVEFDANDPHGHQHGGGGRGTGYNKTTSHF